MKISQKLRLTDLAAAGVFERTPYTANPKRWLPSCLVNHRLKHSAGIILVGFENININPAIYELWGETYAPYTDYGGFLF